MHCSFDHACDAVLREIAPQLSIKVTGRLGYCDGCVGGKGIRETVAKSTSSRADTRMQRLFADLAGPMPKSTGSAQYCLIVVDDATNMEWSVIPPDKSAATVTNGFGTFPAAVNAYGKPKSLRTDTGPEFTNREFQKLMSDNNIRREYTAVDAPTRHAGADSQHK